MPSSRKMLAQAMAEGAPRLCVWRHGRLPASRHDRWVRPDAVAGRRPHPVRRAMCAIDGPDRGRFSLAVPHSDEM